MGILGFDGNPGLQWESRASMGILGFNGNPWLQLGILGFNLF